MNCLKEEGSSTDNAPTITNEEQVAYVQLTGDELRISRLSNDELNKEVMNLMTLQRFDEAGKLLKLYQELKKQ